MEKYESKQQQIRRSAEQIYSALASFNNFSPMVEGRVDEWSADDDVCSFKVKGMKVSLRIAEKIENKQVKIVTGEGGLPIDFSFWIQLKEVAERDTRIRMVLHAELNMMMRMMLGSKLQQGLDQAVEGLAKALNSFR